MVGNTTPGQRNSGLARAALLVAPKKKEKEKDASSHSLITTASPDHVRSLLLVCAMFATACRGMNGRLRQKEFDFAEVMKSKGRKKRTSAPPPLPKPRPSPPSFTPFANKSKPVPLRTSSPRPAVKALASHVLKKEQDVFKESIEKLTLRPAGPFSLPTTSSEMQQATQDVLVGDFVALIG